MIPKAEFLTVEFKSDRKRLSDAELVQALVCLANTEGSLAFSAKDHGHNGPPFPFNLERRAQLRYILDPADVMGDDYPS